jgi:hypothetical protein
VSAYDKREPRYGEDWPQARPVPVAVTDPVATPDPTSATDPIPTIGPEVVGVPKNLTAGEPLPNLDLGIICFSTDQGRKKRSIPSTTNDTADADANDEEVPLQTTFVDYIKDVIASLDGEKCPGKVLVQAPVNTPDNDDEGHRKRSSHLNKRDPRTLAEFIKLVISTYNDCPEEGYRKRHFRPLNEDWYLALRPYRSHSDK